jgi:hypothetical protein
LSLGGSEGDESADTRFDAFCFFVAEQKNAGRHCGPSAQGNDSRNLDQRGRKVQCYSVALSGGVFISSLF